VCSSRPAIVVRGAAGRVAKDGVRLVELDHLLLREAAKGFVEVGHPVRMAGAHAFAEGLANLIRLGVAVNAQDGVVISLRGQVRYSVP
jgi:hypothetical protein